MLTDFLRRAAWVSGVLWLVIGAVIVIGDRSAPRVAFDRAGQTLGVQTQLVLTFSRPMDRAAVEAGWTLDPPVDGVFSWSGKRLAFTPTAGYRRDQTYTLTLADAVTDCFGRPLRQAYRAEFRTLPEALLYIDAERRLRRAVAPFESSEVVSPAHLLALDYVVHPDGDRVYLLAVDAGETEHLTYYSERQALYELNLADGTVTELAGHDGFINKQFALAADGEVLALNRATLSADGLIYSRDIWWRPAAGGAWNKFGREGLGNGDFFLSPVGDQLLAESPAGYLLFALADPQAEPRYVGDFWESHGFSPRGGYLLFENNDGFGSRDYLNHLVMLDRAGGTTAVGVGLGKVADPAWTHDESGLYATVAVEAAGAAPAGPVMHYFDRAAGTLTPLAAPPHGVGDGSGDVQAGSRKLVYERFPEAVAVQDIGMRSFLDDDRRSPYLIADLWFYDPDTATAYNSGLSGRAPGWLP